MTYSKRTMVDDYFYYAAPKFRGHSWVKVTGVRLADVTCKEDGCTYKPIKECMDPRAAYRAHMRKRHRAAWLRMKTKVYVIREEPDIEIIDWRKELLNV